MTRSDACSCLQRHASHITAVDNGESVARALQLIEQGTDLAGNKVISHISASHMQST